VGGTKERAAFPLHCFNWSINLIGRELYIKQLAVSALNVQHLMYLEINNVDLYSFTPALSIVIESLLLKRWWSKGRRISS